MPSHFTPELFAFLRDLKQNNDRAWFKAHQELFEEHVREPALRFIEDFSEPLLAVSPHFTADARKSGGSLFRIQRDTRFGTDKTPYKTHVGIQFRHVAAREDPHAPGFYLHLEPRACFAGAGVWRPATAHAYAIREAIAADPAAWERAVRGERFAEMFGSLEGESLKRPPKGFDPDHPLIGDLKLKDFVATRRFTQAEITSAGFMDAYAATVRTAAPFVRFLCEGLDLGF
jgi:uncharacterized protein (TIGR02453 family)